MAVVRKRIGDLLLDAGIISQEQLQQGIGTAEGIKDATG